MHKCLDSDIIIVILLLYAITMDFKLKNPLVIETDFQIKVFNKSIALTDSEFQQLLTYILRVSKVMLQSITQDKTKKVWIE